MRSLVAIMFIAVSAASCGGGSVGGDPVPVPAAFSVAVKGSAIMKVRPHGQGWVGLADSPQRLTDYSAPVRRLVIFARCTRATAQWLPPAGWSLIDFAAHPSGQLTAVLANSQAIRLIRLGSEGGVLTEANFSDPSAHTDRYYGDEIYLRNPSALVPHATRDAVRVAAVGEQVAMVLRTGRNAVVAYRLAHEAGGFRTRWRTLVEPGVPIGSVFITSGTYDPFSGLENQWRVTMDVDARGRMAVAVLINRTMLTEGHTEHFGEAISPAITNGALVTVIDEHGQRSPSTVVATSRRPEVHAVKWAANTVIVGGRIFSHRLGDGSGWDGLVATVDPFARTVRSLQAVDVNRGDVILDVAATTDGRLLAVGATGYTQNPNGASISESSIPMAVLLNQDGKLVQRLALPSGSRQNQVRSIAIWGSRWLAAGMQDGPGTHSGDDDTTLIRADGYVHALNGTP